MTNEIQVPDYIKELTADSPVDSSNLISSASSVPRISLKGRQFRFIEDGEEVSKEPGPVFFIILGTQPEHGMSKTYYDAGYNPSDTGPPDCSSSDGVHPDSWVNNPQSDSCAHCEKNKWGSATALSGKKAKACRDSKRLMVVKPDEIEGGTIYILNVTVSSLRAMSEYGKILTANKVPMAAAITKISMADSDFPQLEFEFAGVLKKENGMKALERSSKKEWSMGANTQPALEHQEEVEEAPKKSNTPAKPADVDDVLNKW